MWNGSVDFFETEIRADTIRLLDDLNPHSSDDKPILGALARIRG